MPTFFGRRPIGNGRVTQALLEGAALKLTFGGGGSWAVAAPPSGRSYLTVEIDTLVYAPKKRLTSGARQVHSPHRLLRPDSESQLNRRVTTMAGGFLALVAALAAVAVASSASIEGLWSAGLMWARSLSAVGLTEVRGLETLVGTDPAGDIARFYLFTRENPRLPQLLHPSDYESIRSSNFNEKHGTKVLIHGYLSSRLSAWVPSLTEQLLRREDFNVIAVDWSGVTGAATLYPVAVRRTRQVGEAVAKLFSALSNATGVDPATFHVIGHSLGAHAAGYAGRFTPGLGRISGLDPAGPEFEYRSTEERLDPTDAIFVDAIHTDAPSIVEALRGTGGFGMSKAVGHADFYPNGGRSQPACPRTLSESTMWNYVTCDHDIATGYFIQSVNDCQFDSVPCSSYWSYNRRACMQAEPSNVMGFNAMKPESGSATYYLSTLDRSPYCDPRGTA